MDMTTETTTAPRMTRKEARTALLGVRKALREARLLLLEMYEREGWRSLGYCSWRECCRVEFGISERRLYQLLQAGRVERDLYHGSEDVDLGDVPERQLRELARLDTAELRREVWEEATRDGETTAAEIAELVNSRQRHLVSEISRVEEEAREFAREGRGGQPSPASNGDPIDWILRRLEQVKERHAALGDRAAEADRRWNRYVAWVRGE